MKSMIFATLLAFTGAVCLNAVEIEKLVQDTQRMRHKGNIMHMVWWIPTEFFAEVLKQNPALTQQQQEEFTEVLDQYSVFAVGPNDFRSFWGIDTEK